MTFNNTNQMLWYGNQMRMQIIKFDGKQMMLTVCAMDRGEIYTILSNRHVGNGNEFMVDGTNLNRLILQGRNLKIRSKTDLHTNCKDIGEEATTDKGIRVNLSFVSLIILLMEVLFL